MKKIVSIIFILMLLQLTISAQEKIRGQAPYNNNPTWYDFSRVRIWDMWRMPKDTLTTADTGSLAFKGNVLYYKSGPWISLASAMSNTKAGMGMTKSNDTLHAGGFVNGIQRLITPNSFAVGHPFSYLQLVNRSHTDSLNGYGLGTGGHALINEGYQFTDATYAPAMLSITRFLAEWANDTANLQYGGAQSILAQRWYDSVSTRFGPSATKKPIVLADAGINITNQFFPPRDSADLFVDKDGKTGASIHSLVGIGAKWGYNFHVFSALGMPYTPGFVSTIDFQRENSNTRYRSITGNGVSGFLASYRTEQRAINSSVPVPAHPNYISSVTGYTDIGNTDLNTGTDLTKAQVLQRSADDTVTSFLSKKLWSPTNTIKNAYAFRSLDDSSVLFHQGYTYFGPQLPTHDNGLWPQYRLTVMGDHYADGSIWLNRAGRVVGGNTVSGFNTPNYLYFLGKDSSTMVYMGDGEDKGGTILGYAKYANSGNPGGLDVYINNEYVSGNTTPQPLTSATTKFRVNFYNRGTYYLDRIAFGYNKVVIKAQDSISMASGHYRFLGIPVTTSKPYFIMYDGNEMYAVDGAGSGSPSGWDNMLSLGQAQTADRSVSLSGHKLDFVGTKTTTIHPTGNIQLGSAARLSTNGTDTLKITQALNDTIGADFAARSINFYNSGTKEITQSRIWAPQGDFLNIHAQGQINLEAPLLTINQPTIFYMGAAAPLLFHGSGNGPTPNLIDIYNADTVKPQNNSGIGFGTNMGGLTMGVKVDIARIAAIITDTARHSPDGDLQFYTMKDSVFAENMRLQGNGQLKLNKYGSGTITGTPTGSAGFDASGNVIERPLVDTGHYVPGVHGGANYASSSALNGSWTRTGNIVTVYIAGNVTATAGGSAVIFDLDLPVPSDFTDQYDAKGSGNATYAGSAETCWALANTTNDRFQIATSNIGSTNARSFFISIQYTIK